MKRCQRFEPDFIDFNDDNDIRVSVLDPVYECRVVFVGRQYIR